MIRGKTMKKVLFATTALVATAGIAAAQDDAPAVGVAVTGFAEIGVFDGGDDSELQFHTDIDATFTMTGSTDTGLTFGASIDLDESDTDDTLDVAVNEQDDDEGAGEGGGLTIDPIEVGGSPAFDNSLQGGEEIFISGPFGTLTMGDTDGAYDWALQEAIIGSALTDNHEHAGYSGNSGLDGTYDGQIARYQRTLGGFGVAVSAEIDDEGVGDPVLGIGANYSTQFGSFRGNPIGIGFGLGYQRIDAFDPIGDAEDALDDLLDDDDDGDDDEQDVREVYGISADLDLGGGLRAIVNYSEGDDGDGDDFDHYGIAVGYTVDALTVAANYGRRNNPAVAQVDDAGEAVLDAVGEAVFDDADADGYGVVVNYDLGGGAQAQFGYGHSESGDEDDSTYSLGIAMSF